MGEWLCVELWNNGMIRVDRQDPFPGPSVSKGDGEIRSNKPVFEMTISRSPGWISEIWTVGYAGSRRYKGYQMVEWWLGLIEIWGAVRRDVVIIEKDGEE